MSGTSYADFDQSYDPINGLENNGGAGRYTVQGGDTLQSIAQNLWGDASLWYKLADANGMDGSETLTAGYDLIVPTNVTSTHNTSGTYCVYDPNQAIGDVSPTAPRPQAAAHKNGCGAFGAILLVAVAVAVTIVTSGALAAASISAAGGGSVGLGTGITAAFGGTVAAGAGATVAGSFALTGLGLVTVGATAAAAASVISDISRPSILFNSS